MSSTRPCNTPSWRSGPPTSPQLRALRRLAASRGESFAYPTTAGDASDEIDRLKTRRPSNRVERARERGVRKQLPVGAGLTNAASVRDDEVVGYGSTARWAARGDDFESAALAAPWDLRARRTRNAKLNADSAARRRAA